MVGTITFLYFKYEKPFNDDDASYMDANIIAFDSDTDNVIKTGYIIKTGEIL